MAEVSMTIGGHAYRLACRDGEEAALRSAGRLLDEKVSELKQAMGSAGEARLLLMAGLLLSGQLLEGTTPATAATGSDAQRDGGKLDALVDRVEKLALALEEAVSVD